MSRTVTLPDLNQDVTNRVVAIPPLPRSTGDIGQIVSNDISLVRMENSDGFWDPEAPTSPFFGTDVTAFRFRIERSGILIFDGFIRNISSENQVRTAEVSLRSALQIALERGIIYVSDAQETPANAIRRIASLYKIPVDTGTFAGSSSFYADNKAFVTVNLSKPEMTVLDAIQTIADIGNAKVYALNGVLFYDVTRARSSIAVRTFSDRSTGPVTLYSHPKAEVVEKDKSAGYRIETLRGVVTAGAESEQSRSISAGAEAPVRLVSRQAGIFLGDKRIEYQQLLQKRISFMVPAEIADGLPLGAPITLDYTSRNWPPLLLDIIGIDPGTLTETRITGLTR